MCRKRLLFGSLPKGNLGFGFKVYWGIPSGFHVFIDLFRWQVILRTKKENNNGQ